MFSKRFVIRCFDFPNLIFFRLAFILFAGFLLNNPVACGNGLRGNDPDELHHKPDTVFIHKGRYLLSKNTSITIPRDTFYLIPPLKRSDKEAGAYQNSQIFYDTVYKKFSHNKLTQLLYYLAFTAPKQSVLPENAQVVASAGPFEQFHDKIIRAIDIRVLPPMGTTVYDTGRIAVTGIGKALNSVHINTRKYVIRRNLLFKKGDRVIPSVLADNERLLRNISAIENVRIIVVPACPGSDSVDLLVVTKDVWSIGIDVPLITAQQVRFRIYDANFLGLGDRLTTNMSLGLYRAPFFMFEGLSYTFSNIGGSMINATIDYATDHIGNMTMLLRFDRVFLTNLTKWAGGAYTSGNANVNELPNLNNIKYWYNSEGLWLGRAFLLKKQKETSRAVIAQAVYRLHYTSRPFETIDSNSSYYNRLQVLTTFSVSRNNYYLTDFVLDFGKTEDLPYGHLFQLTAGPDQSDFYTRLYSGVNLSMGNFFEKIGYISAYVKFGGFLNHSSFEDAVVKCNLQYFTPLLKSHDKRYKFRTFCSADYRYAFNSRSNNRDGYDANLDFKIDKINNADYFSGVKVISGKLSAVCYTPWYFYGFCFAGRVELQTGLVAKKNQPLFKTPVFSSMGFSLIIKNDNLIFPAFLLSAYYYPSNAGNDRQLQFMINSDLHIHYYDFNVTAPHEENLSN